MITLLVGLPGVGKSTWARKYFPEWIDPNFLEFLSSDDVVEAVALVKGTTYDAEFSNSIKFADLYVRGKFLQLLEEGSSKRIVVDRTNLTPKSRKFWISNALQFGYEVEAIFFETPRDALWKRRLASRPGKAIPDSVLQNMQKGLTMPTAKEKISTVSVVDERGNLRGVY